MSWNFIGRYQTEGDIMTTANDWNLGPGGLMFCLENENMYSLWIDISAKGTAPGGGKWQHFAVDVNSDGFANVAKELKLRGVAPGNATVTKNGRKSHYIVLYYA